jgi:hypothetical protein
VRHGAIDLTRFVESIEAIDSEDARSQVA